MVCYRISVRGQAEREKTYISSWLLFGKFGYYLVSKEWVFKEDERKWVVRSVGSEIPTKKAAAIQLVRNVNQVESSEQHQAATYPLYHHYCMRLITPLEVLLH